jgi:hypothetical protein
VKPLVLAVAILVACTTPLPGAESLDVEKDENGLLLTEDGGRVLYYQRAPKSLDGRFTRANYVHPLYGLDGRELTEDFPQDHPHHRGVFWAWHQLYVSDERLGDGWSTQDFTCDVTSVETERTDAGPLTVRIEAAWKSPLPTDEPGRANPVVEESTRITIHRRTGNVRLLDFPISLRALRPGVRLGGSDDDKGYGGFSVRMKLPAGLRFEGPEGPVSPQSTAVSAGRWMNFAAEDWGLAVVAHRDNPAPRDEWILRPARSMQNAAFPGRRAVPISERNPLVLRYRLVVHDGRLDAKAIERLQGDFDRSRPLAAVPSRP